MAPSDVLKVEMLDVFADKVHTALISFSTMLGAQGNTEAEDYTSEMASLFEGALSKARLQVKSEDDEP